MDDRAFALEIWRQLEPRQVVRNAPAVAESPVRLAAIKQEIIVEISARADIGRDRAPVAAVTACGERRLIVLEALFEQPILVAAINLEFQMVAKHGCHRGSKRPTA